MKRRILAAAAVALLVSTGSALADGGRPISYGQQYLAALTAQDVQWTNGRRANVWSFQGAGDGCATVRMESVAFDPAIQIVRDSLNGATVARGSTEARADGLRPSETYYVIATSVGSGEELGAYVISLARCQ
jgi:hypothetical protein